MLVQQIILKGILSPFYFFTYQAKYSKSFQNLLQTWNTCKLFKFECISKGQVLFWYIFKLCRFLTLKFWRFNINILFSSKKSYFIPFRFEICVDHEGQVSIISWIMPPFLCWFNLINQARRNVEPLCPTCFVNCMH
jgi:glycosyltransferase involved in cell wall biosynthesis